MNDMKTIKVFVASSSELGLERMMIADFILDLNRNVKPLGIKLKPIMWEYMDSSMRAARKEDEYLDKLRDCELCIVLFWKTLGQYTKEELDEAISGMNADRNPKNIYVLFKDSAEIITEELAEFKNSFKQKMTGIHCTYFDNPKELQYILNHIINDYTGGLLT